MPRRAGRSCSEHAPLLKAHQHARRSSSTILWLLSAKPAAAVMLWEPARHVTDHDILVATRTRARESNGRSQWAGCLLRNANTRRPHQELARQRILYRVVSTETAGGRQKFVHQSTKRKVVMASSGGGGGVTAERRPLQTLVLYLHGPCSGPLLRDCVERALASHLPATSVDPASRLCEWLDARDLPTVTEASSALALSRMASVLRGASLGTGGERPAACRAIWHQYGRDCSFMAIGATQGASEPIAFGPVLSRCMQEYADATNVRVDEVEPAAAPEPGASAALNIADLSAKWLTHHSLTELLVSAFCVTSALLSGRSRIAIDACLSDCARQRCDAIVPVEVEVSNERRLQDITDRVHALVTSEKRAPSAMLSSRWGVVARGKPQNTSDFRCGALRATALPIAHFADWDIRATLFEHGQPRLAVECFFSPPIVADLLAHVLRCTIAKPDAKISHVTAVA